MRKLYYFILFLTYSTYSYEIKLEGFFLNSSNNSFYINGASFSKKIEMDKKGYFNVNLEIPYIGLYHLNIEKKDIHLYLNKNTHLVINADLLNFIDSIQFKGIGTEENNYWLQKQKLTRNHFDYEKFLKQNKKDSISSEVLHDLKEKLTTLLHSKQGLDTSFVRLEKKNIHYDLLTTQKINYLYSSIKKMDLVDLNRFDINDYILKSESEEDFLFSSSYKSILVKSIKAKIEQINTEQDKYLGKYYLVIFDNIKSRYIKDYLLEQAIPDINSDNPEMDNVFNKITNNTTNPQIIDKATKLYKRNKVTKIGSPIAPFQFKDINEKLVSSNDLKGKYSFITIWTSWCSNCLLEIDHINKLSEQFKNIQFVNISIDATPEKNDWKKVIKTKKYRGIHLLADKQDKSDFIKNFVHDKIQKYILISPEGNLILTDAPSPSDQRLISKFKELGI